MTLKGLVLGIMGTHALANSSSMYTFHDQTFPEPDTTSLPSPFTDIGPGEIDKLINIVNHARSQVKVRAFAMPKVSWDYALQTQLNQAVLDIDTEWWFSKTQNKSRYNGQVLMDYAPFNKAFPNYDLFMDDGCESISNGISKVFWMRAVNQAKFFNYKKCTDTLQHSKWGYVNNYFSCSGINRNVTLLVSNKPWSWMWQYYPKMVNDDVDKIACMLLGRGGPNIDGGYRPNHFFCYWGKKSHPQTSEKPYVSIKRGQKPGDGCPGKVVNKLCI